MAYSGFGEYTGTLSHDINYTAVTNLTSNLDNSLLLYAILGLCCVILIVLLCELLCFNYQHQLWRRKSNIRTSFVCDTHLSKATSVTGLDHGPVDKNVQLQVDLQRNGSIMTETAAYCKNKKTLFCVLSKSLENLSRKPSGMESPLLSCSQTSDLENELFSSDQTKILVSHPVTGCSKWQYNLHECTCSSTNTLPAAHVKKKSVTRLNIHMAQLCRSYNWASAPTDYINPCASNSTSSEREWHEMDNLITPVGHYDDSTEFLYGSHTKESKFLDPYACADIFSESLELDFGDIEEAVWKAQSSSGSSNSYDCSSTPKMSPFSTDEIISSLPLDIHGHPRAWFVPLNELYHEPVRHSFNDLSDEHHSLLQAEVPANFEDYNISQAMQLDTIVNAAASGSCKQDCISSINSAGSQQYKDVFQAESQCQSSWSDSGIPSCSNLRSISSENEGKKLTLWEQRENRPVLLLQTSIGANLSPHSDEKS